MKPKLTKRMALLISLLMVVDLRLMAGSSPIHLSRSAGLSKRQARFARGLPVRRDVPISMAYKCLAMIDATAFGELELLGFGFILGVLS